MSNVNVNETIEGREYTIEQLGDHLKDILTKIFSSPSEPDLNDVYSSQLISESIIAMVPTEFKEIKDSVSQLHDSVAILANATKDLLKRIDAMEKRKGKDE